VVQNLKVLKGRGFKEVVLTGIHLGVYGRDLNPPFLLEALLRQLEKEGTPDRIRLSSIEPGDFSRSLITVLAQSDKVCPHLHIPIQSGDDDLLKKMNRDYDRSFLSDLVQELHRQISNLSVGADVMVGFPGETEERFRHTYELIESLPFSYLHVFPFSKRKGTPAFQFPQGANGREIKEGAEVMRELGKQKRQAFYRQYLGQTLSVLIEDRRERETGRRKGFSRNYIPVSLTGGNGTGKHLDGVNQEVTVRVIELAEKGVIGEVLEK
jgi:threonylcarbamoyladenosine tRNA methylthiotransferase MtaB